MYDVFQSQSNFPCTQFHRAKQSSRRASLHPTTKFTCAPLHILRRLPPGPLCGSKDGCYTTPATRRSAIKVDDKKAEIYRRPIARSTFCPSFVRTECVLLSSSSSSSPESPYIIYLYICLLVHSTVCVCVCLCEQLL